jgi:hypothetical protein
LSITQIEELLLLAEEATPKSYKKAVSGDNSAEWKEAIKAEYKSLLDHDTFSIVNRPKDTKVIRSHHVFKIKMDDQGQISKFKARLVARGDTQVEGENFFEVFSPTLRSESIRRLVAYAVQSGGQIHHLDVQTAFLNAPLDEDV